MQFLVNQPVRVGKEWHGAGRRGIHLCTVESEGRTWHIVQLHGEPVPSVLLAGTIEKDDSHATLNSLKNTTPAYRVKSWKEETY